MKKILSAMLLTVAFASCQHDDIPRISEASESTAPQKTKSCYAIPPDSAIAYLNEFLESSDPSSRSDAQKIVATLKPIRYNATASRSKMDDIEGENLLYIANFEQDQGYAILAADSRIRDKVIAVADEGSLSDATVYSAMELANAYRPIIPGYPTDGPGFFTLPEYGDEVFMNPNTVVLYDETEGDTLVGNFSGDDGETGDEGSSPDSEDDRATIPQLITSKLCTDYAMDEIENYENQQRHIQNTDNEPTTDGVDTGNRTETIESAWNTLEESPKILHAYRNWHQRDPFNDWCPNRRLAILFGHKKKASAGCVPLAIAKVLTHFEMPTTFTYNGHTIDWNGLKPILRDSVSAAALLKAIGDGCGSWYFYYGTFTFPHKATSFMRSVGLYNAHSHGYSFGRVTSMIDEGKPLLIYSIPGINIFKSHCWNIDGYKIKERTITTNTYLAGLLVSSKEKKETYNMVHCDFGWGGDCNGYYVSGIFKISDPNVERDNGSTFDKSTSYNHLIRVITY